MFRPIKSHTCSIGFMSGDIAGHGIVWTASCCKICCTIRALCGLALSSMNIGLSANAWLSKWRTTRGEFRTMVFPTWLYDKAIPTYIFSYLIMWQEKSELYFSYLIMWQDNYALYFFYLIMWQDNYKLYFFHLIIWQDNYVIFFLPDYTTSQLRSIFSYLIMW